MRHLVVALAALIGFAPAALAGGFSNIVVRVSRGPGPGELTLDWTGGVALHAPFAVFRSDNPATLSGASAPVGQTSSTVFSDTPPVGTAFFYDVAGNGCAAGSVSQRFTSLAMQGCAGVVSFAARASLCATGCHVCSATEWVGSRRSDAPQHHYWTADILGYAGSAGCGCAAVTSGGTACSAGRPMRVCTPGCAGGSDPEGNTCTWQQCGLGAINPNQYFGGCENDPTAGALCCCS